MKPSTYAEENRRRDELLGLGRSAGLEVDYCIITWAGEAPTQSRAVATDSAAELKRLRVEIVTIPTTFE